MGPLEESSDLTLDFTKLEKVGAQVAATRAAGAAVRSRTRESSRARMP